MNFAYVDESGYPDRLVSATSGVQPVFAIGGFLIDQTQLSRMTADFLNLKRRFYPGILPGTKILDRILVEVKGTEIRKHLREGRRRQIRHDIGFLNCVFSLLETVGARVLARVLVKAIGKSISVRSVYTSSVQSLCRDYQHFLASTSDTGFMIMDGRSFDENVKVAHSIFTQKFQVGGDAFDRIPELPTFGNSVNHAGLQIADLLCSALIAPIAMYAYCTGHVTNPVHVNQSYGILKRRYATRLKAMQYRYQDPGGRWRGGITVSDALAGRPGSLLFQ